jgi:hypothetical protein
MREVGYDLAEHASKSLEEFNGRRIDVAVTMGCGDACPLVLADRREEWNIPDPRELPDDEFRAVRDLIERKVLTLLASLAGDGERDALQWPVGSRRYRGRPSSVVAGSFQSRRD